MVFLNMKSNTERFVDLHTGITDAFGSLLQGLQLESHVMLKDLRMPDYRDDFDEVKQLQRQLLDDFHSAWGMAKLSFPLTPITPKPSPASGSLLSSQTNGSDTATPPPPLSSSSDGPNAAPPSPLISPQIKGSEGSALPLSVPFPHNDGPDTISPFPQAAKTPVESTGGANAGLRARSNDRCCQLVLQQGDISMWFRDGESDAIVNSTNTLMKPTSDASNGAIHSGAGPELWGYIESTVPEEKRHNLRCECGHVSVTKQAPEEAAAAAGTCPGCRQTGTKRTGEVVPYRLRPKQARVTAGYGLFAKYIVHTVALGFDGKSKAEAVTHMRHMYESCLREANRHRSIRYLAFPAIACGAKGLPPKYAAEAAIEACRKEAGNLEEIHFVLQDQRAWVAWSTIATNFKQGAASDNFVGGHIQPNNMGIMPVAII